MVLEFSMNVLHVSKSEKDKNLFCIEGNGTFSEGEAVMQFGRVGRMLAILVVVVLISGCLNGSEGGGLQPNATQTTSTSSLQLVFPDKVSFKAILEVFQNGTLIANYSYLGKIDYNSKSASVNLSVVYNPGNKHLTGNWHHKTILIENGSKVKVFNVPPATWTLIPENKSLEIIEEVFYENPYRYLFKIANDSGVLANGNLSLELKENQAVSLLSPLMWGRKPPKIQMKGWVSVKDGRIVAARISGVNGSRRYVFNLEVIG